jgi:hypothetical protein
MSWISSSLAGFQVSIYGRFWVSPEAFGCRDGRLSAICYQCAPATDPMSKEFRFKLSHYHKNESLDFASDSCTLEVPPETNIT